MTTKARRRPRNRRHLTENTTSISARGVDRGKRTIYGVKVLGFESTNGRRYLRQAVATALPMYEGRSVRIDHPTKPGEQRSSADVFGRLREVALGTDGLYANLEYLESHPLAERICEAAERMPEQFGLSHNAEGEGETTPDGIYVVSRITEVHSVDIVADPATTRGLFEQEQKECGMYGDDKEKMMEQPEEEPGAAAPAAGEGIKAEIMAAVDAALGGDEGALAKIKDLIKLHMKHHGEPAAAEEDMDAPPEKEKETKEAEDDDDDDKKDMEEAEVDEAGSDRIRGKKQDEQIAAMWAKDPDYSRKGVKVGKGPGKGRESRERPLSAFDAMSLCEKAGITYDRTLLESLCLASDDLRQRLIEREQKRQQTKPAQKPRTQTAAAVNGTENDEDRGPKSWADLARRLGRKVEA